MEKETITIGTTEWKHDTINTMKVDEFLRICKDAAAVVGLPVIAVHTLHSESARKDGDPLEYIEIRFKAPNGRKAWITYNKAKGGNNGADEHFPGEYFRFAVCGDTLPPADGGTWIHKTNIEYGEETVSEGYIRSIIEILATTANANPPPPNENDDK